MGDSLRVLMLNIEYPPLGGGASPVTRGLARALVARGHAVDVVTMGRRGLPREESDHGVRVLRLPTLRSRIELSRLHELATYVVLAILKARSLASAARYDVCHAHFVLPTGLVPFLLRRRRGFPPYLITCHGSDLPGYNPDRFTRVHRLSPGLIRRILAASSAVIAPSAALESLLRSGFGGAATRVARIANGVDVERFETTPKEPRILVASRLFERKGVQHVIQALGELSDRSFTLDIAGDGPARRELERLARATAIPCRFHGWVSRDRLDRLFERARIFVLATTSDNFPVSLLEAMAARCAVVTTRAGGCPEVVGDAGLLVDPADVPALTRALGILLADPALASTMGERAHQRVGLNFGWAAIAEAHEALYRRVIGATA